MNFSLPSFGRRSLVGLDIGSNSVKAVEIAQKGKDKGFELRSLGVAPMPGEAIVQGAFLNSSAIVEAIQEAVQTGRIKTKEVAAAVAGTDSHGVRPRAPGCRGLRAAHPGLAAPCGRAGRVAVGGAAAGLSPGDRRRGDRAQRGRSGQPLPGRRAPDGGDWKSVW